MFSLDESISAESDFESTDISSAGSVLEAEPSLADPSSQSLLQSLSQSPAQLAVASVAEASEPDAAGAFHQGRAGVGAGFVQPIRHKQNASAKLINVLFISFSTARPRGNKVQLVLRSNIDRIRSIINPNLDGAGLVISMVFLS